MKASKYFYVFLLMVFTLPFAACNDTDDGSYVAPITVYEKVKGNWKATTVKQVDEIAKANSQSPNEMVLTSQFDFETFSISLNVDNNNEPTTFSVGGTSPRFFAVEGYWNLAYPFQNTDGSASIINLYSDAAKANKVGELAITAIPGGTNTMELKFSRKTKEGVTFVSYVYQLSPVIE